MTLQRMPRVGWGSSVSDYLLAGRAGDGIPVRWRDLAHSSKRVVVSTQPPIQSVWHPSPRSSGRSVSLAIQSSYTSISSLGFHGLCQVTFTFYHMQ